MAKRLVVVGNGMVGQKFLDELSASGTAELWKVTVFGAESRPAYDRVHLSRYFDGSTADDLNVADPAVNARFHMRIGERVVSIDRASRTVSTEEGNDVTYDVLVLATGSYPFIPPLKGADGPGCFAYRTIDDLDAIRDMASGSKARSGAVIGGGLLGLEAANALKNLGLTTNVVELGSHLMPVQLDGGAGAVLRSEIESLGILVHTGVSVARIGRSGGRASGRVRQLELSDGSVVHSDLVVFSAGIRPCDELARECGLDVGERGGIVIDDTCLTSDPSVYAIGECAVHRGRIYGLVSPGYAMARVAAQRISGGSETFPGADMSAKLKLLGVSVASFGDCHATTLGSREIIWHDSIAGVHRKLVVNSGGDRLLGGVLVGDADDFSTLSALANGNATLSCNPAELAAPGAARSPSLGPDALPADAIVCNCNNVTKAAICTAISGGGAGGGMPTTIGEVKGLTSAGTGCGSCVPLLGRLLDSELTKAGMTVDRSLCEHFSHTRQELFDIIRVRHVRTFAELIEGWGRGRGCEICKPAAASMLASHWNEYILETPHSPLQDTNDAYLANLQRDGSYSIVPRVPGGEITPHQLIVLGEVAQEFDLYTKITGGQRIDLFGARVEQLPSIWRRLVDAGFESGHAYGKALRTVKSCVGTAWCRYGVQDSTRLAIDLELRYRGLRAPHKIKAAVSGCARECAEAQGKDFGVIATEKGWNLFVCGNGGMRPQHAVLFASDLDADTLVRYVDRFLMFYIRTADRLERTATWLNRQDGGIDYLRRVIIDDALGICDQLELEMAHHVETYQCEWKTTIEDPNRMERFRRFVNTDDADSTLVYIRERGQKRPDQSRREAIDRVAAG